MAATLVSFALLALATRANAESHTVKFDNQCGYGTPFLISGANVLSQGEPYTSNGPLSSAISYLQTGQCGFNGEQCALIEMTLGNPTVPGSGSSSDISLISPHALNVPVAFSYFNGCDGTGASCATKDCSTAFFQPDDTTVQVACQTDNAGLLITFCGNGAGASSSPKAASSTSTHKVSSTSSHVSATSSSKAPVNVASSPALSSSVASSSAASSSAVTSTESAATSTKPSRKTCPTSSASKRSSHDHASKRHHRSRHTH